MSTYSAGRATVRAEENSEESSKMRIMMPMKSVIVLGRTRGVVDARTNGDEAAERV